MPSEKPKIIFVATEELEERIEAHVDGLVLGEENSLPILKEALCTDDHNIAFSAARSS